MALILEKERELVANFGRKLIADGLTRGTAGNISIFNREEGLFAISPSGVPYEEVHPEDVVVLNLRGETVDGDLKPSSEHELHRIFYEKREDINALVHTHSPACAAYSCLNKSLPAFHYMIAVAGPDVRCARYASFGTPELARYAYEAMEDRNAVFLAHHGLIAGASHIAQAYNIAAEIEYMCHIYSIAKTYDEPISFLSKAEMENMVERFKSYGQAKEAK